MDTYIRTIIDHSRAGKLIDPNEIKSLFSVPLLSEEAMLIQWAAREISYETCSGLAEVHGQIGVNSGPCMCNCAFCSFATSNGIFKEQQVQPIDEILHKCHLLEQQGANAIYLMATASFSLSSFLDIAREVRLHLDQDILLIANIGDFDYQAALALKEAGFIGVYHALRLGEGQATRIKPKKRFLSFESAHRAGLLLGTCLEPVGPEHSLDELVEKTLITREVSPVFSGAARRINIDGSTLAPLGMVSETRMAHILAVVRLAMGRNVPGNCTHEPNVVGAQAGANLLWAEAGSNPRDMVRETETNRGYDVDRCKNIFAEAEWKTLSGPSRFFGRAN